jgi:primosomal protein N''
MSYPAYVIADELTAIARFDVEMQSRIASMLSKCSPEQKSLISATSLGMESGYAKDAAFLADLLDEKAEAQ